MIQPALSADSDQEASGRALRIRKLSKAVIATVATHAWALEF